MPDQAGAGRAASERRGRAHRLRRRIGTWSNSGGRTGRSTSGSSPPTWSRSTAAPICRGLFISSSGFTDQAIRDLGSILPLRLVLCQLQEIVLLLEEGRDLKELLRAKVRAAETEQKPLASDSKS